MRKDEAREAIIKIICAFDDPGCIKCQGKVDAILALEIEEFENLEGYVEMSVMLDEIFYTKTRDEWLKVLAQHDLPAGPVNSLSELKDEAREALAQIVLEIRLYLLCTEFAPKPFTRKVNPDVLKVDFPNKILNLKDSQGNPYIAVLSKDQARPEDAHHFIDSMWQAGYDTAQEDMLKAGFRRIEL